MGNTYFISDQHFFHTNIIKMLNRPYKNVKEMNSDIVAKHNKTVKPGDTCYHLGDLAMLSKNQINKIEPLINQLNGNNVLIMGNHDENHPFTYMNMGFISVHTSLLLPEDNRFMLAHDPAVSCVDRSKYWIVGHVHDLFRVCENCINVGFDIWGQPIDLETVKLALRILD